MLTDEPPVQRIWSYLRAILCDVGSAQNNCSNIKYDLPLILGSLTPVSGQKLITDDLKTFEKQIDSLEYAATSAASDLGEIPRWTRLIRDALNKMKEAKND